MVDELGLVSLTDSLIKQDHQQRQVSVGQCVKAMILNGLGFVNRTLYLMPHFFKDKPVERLLGSDIQAEHLNDDALGRALDAIYAYGPTEFYAQLAAHERAEQRVNRQHLKQSQTEYNDRKTDCALGVPALCWHTCAIDRQRPIIRIKLQLAS